MLDYVRLSGISIDIVLRSVHHYDQLSRAGAYVAQFVSYSGIEVQALALLQHILVFSYRHFDSTFEHINELFSLMMILRSRAVVKPETIIPTPYTMGTFFQIRIRIFCGDRQKSLFRSSDST